ncbi:phosphotransferase [Polyangium sp. 15x6]|uniref:phosphotransferase n=1 Tax=Polyangium sp. 15x6 TaxID=3042687 RepID=UPI00249B001A|nr:phosphotransferase [Polyangium sp. 15x6]
MLGTFWGTRWSDLPVSPLSVQNAEPLSHTAGLWHIGSAGAGHVLKVQLNRGAARKPEFYPLKENVMAHCRAHGVPVLEAVPAVDGSTSVWCDGLVCELLPRCPGIAARRSTPAQAAAVARAGLDLRYALDRLPDGVMADLAPIPLPRMVEEERWPVALADAEKRLLPMAERRDDAWSRAAASALRGVIRAGALMHQAGIPVVGESPDRPSVVHSDLHYHHFLVPASGAQPTVLAILDFDNLHVGDRLLDLAWIAEVTGGVADPSARADGLSAFLAAARARGLLQPGEARLLMPLLLAHSLPVIVDIAKDILVRGILSRLWSDYFELLSSTRRLHLHALLTACPVA